MKKYIIKRLISIIPVLIGISIVVFFLIRMIPGDPASLMLSSSQSSDPQFIAKFNAEYGLDKPIIVQYIMWMKKMVTGDMGDSIFLRDKVISIILKKFPVTLTLTIGASLVVVVVGLLIGVFAAVISSSGKYKAVDKILSAVPIAVLTIPDFALGLFLMFVFSVKLNLLPPVGFESVSGNTNYLDVIRHMILPSLTLAGASSAATVRLVRSSVLEVIREEYIIAANARGIKPIRILFGHVLRNALIPVVTNTGVMFGSMLGGAVIVETIFALPGMGKMMVDAILMRDYPMVQGGALFIAFSYVLINLIVDFSYSLIDPRIKYE
ncbi:MAG: ABC transporter permease [Actinomycetota bacterium]|nr:ABC transporter permease [Actinomycetota bacterium]